MSSFCHFSHFWRAYNQHGMTKISKKRTNFLFLPHSQKSQRMIKKRHIYLFNYSFRIEILYEYVLHVCKCMHRKSSKTNEQLLVSSLTIHYQVIFNLLKSSIYIYMSIVNAPSQKRINMKRSPVFLFEWNSASAITTIQLDSSLV